MKPGEGRVSWRTQSRLPVWFWLGLVLWLPAGCAGDRPHLDQALLTDKGAAVRNEGVADVYTVFCPDVLEIAVDGRPGLSGRRPVIVDGRIDLGYLGRLRVEGRTVPAITNRIAEVAGVPPEQVHVRVVDFNSQKVYLTGEGNGVQRAVAYRGSETVLDLLQRVGGITPGAAPGSVHVIRTHVAEGKPPEVYHIDLEPIVLRHDQRSNLRLQPFDQIYIGETRKSSLQKCFPHWIQPLYKSICGLYRPFIGGGTAAQDKEPAKQDKVTAK